MPRDFDDVRRQAEHALIDLPDGPALVRQIRDVALEFTEKALEKMGLALGVEPESLTNEQIGILSAEVSTMFCKEIIYLREVVANA